MRTHAKKHSRLVEYPDSIMEDIQKLMTWFWYILIAMLIFLLVIHFKTELLWIGDRLRDSWYYLASNLQRFLNWH
jgi:hypothetical protein